MRVHAITTSRVATTVAFTSIRFNATTSAAHFSILIFEWRVVKKNNNYEAG